MKWAVLPIMSVHEAADYEIMQHQERDHKGDVPFDTVGSLKGKTITVPEGHAFIAVGELWRMRQCLEFGLDLFGSLVLQGKPGGVLCTGNIGKASIQRRAQFVKGAAKYFATGGKKILLMSELSKAGYAHHRATKSLARVQVMWVKNYHADRLDTLFHLPSTLAIDASTFKKEIGDSKFLHMTTGKLGADYGHKINDRSARV